MNSGCYPKGTYKEAKRLMAWYERGVLVWGEIVMGLAGNQGLSWNEAAGILRERFWELAE